MCRSTESWEALLDGISPTPWEFEGLDDLRSNDGEPLIGGDSTGGGYVMGDANGEIIAAAPDAVAELVRTRRALEDLRDMYDALATGDCAVASQHRNSRDAITRILEGHNDE